MGQQQTRKGGTFEDSIFMGAAPVVSSLHVIFLSIIFWDKVLLAWAQISPKENFQDTNLKFDLLSDYSYIGTIEEL